mmetsp:Transcript_32177/g.76501  ORF Transcript_32177/g.76501 Transcript_32177/m.76501 type:complete len:280 (+) Transcript_32177:830-1669(+)
MRGGASPLLFLCCEGEQRNPRPLFSFSVSWGEARKPSRWGRLRLRIIQGGWIESTAALVSFSAFLVRHPHRSRTSSARRCSRQASLSLPPKDACHADRSKPPQSAPAGTSSLLSRSLLSCLVRLVLLHPQGGLRGVCLPFLLKCADPLLLLRSYVVLICCLARTQLPYLPGRRKLCGQEHCVPAMLVAHVQLIHRRFQGQELPVDLAFEKKMNSEHRKLRRVLFRNSGRPRKNNCEIEYRALISKRVYYFLVMLQVYTNLFFSLLKFASQAVKASLTHA